MAWVGYDGLIHAVLVTNLQESAVFALGPTGHRWRGFVPVTRCPGEWAGRWRASIGYQVDAGVIHLRVADNVGEFWMLASTEGGVSTVAGPGMFVPGFGPVAAIASADWVAKGGRVYFTAEAVGSSNPGSRYAVVAANGTEAQLVLAGGSLGDRGDAPMVLDVDGDRVAVAVANKDSRAGFGGFTSTWESRR